MACDLRVQQLRQTGASVLHHGPNALVHARQDVAQPPRRAATKRLRTISIRLNRLLETVQALQNMVVGRHIVDLHMRSATTDEVFPLPVE